jgi:hypothetical protein
VAKEFVAYLKTNPTTYPNDELDELLIKLAEYFRRFVVLPEKHWASVMATWTLGTYLFPMFQAYPYLRLTSGEPGCGKSLLGQILANVSFNGQFMSSPTEANLFHLPEQNRGVQVWDEIEIANRVERSKFQGLQAILLVGYRNGAEIPRQVGNNWDQQVKYHVFCPRVLIGLSRLPETARQRSIELRLRKRMPGQEAQIYRMDDQATEEANLRAKCVLTALKCAVGVNQLYRDDGLRTNIVALLGKAGREADDIWLPLFAIAAACSDETKIDSMQNSLIGDLAKAATELAECRDNPLLTDSTQLHEVRSAAPSRRTEIKEPDRALVAALYVLGCGEAMEPTELAHAVSERVNDKVSAQWLSKSLNRFGIRARKLGKGSRRVFAVPSAELRRAEAKLGIESPYEPGDSGQQGREGQQEAMMIYR